MSSGLLAGGRSAPDGERQKNVKQGQADVAAVARGPQPP